MHEHEVNYYSNPFWDTQNTNKCSKYIKVNDRIAPDHLKLPAYE